MAAELGRPLDQSRVKRRFGPGAFDQQDLELANCRPGADFSKQGGVKASPRVGIAPVVLRTANGAAPAETGKIDELKVGNIVARNLRIVTSPGLGGLDVLGMNFLSKLESWRVEGRTLVLVPHHPQNAGV